MASSGEVMAVEFFQGNLLASQFGMCAACLLAYDISLSLFILFFAETEPFPVSNDVR